MAWSILLGSLAAFLSTGVYLGVALGAAGLLLLHFSADGATAMAMNAVWNSFTDFTISSVAVFIYLGEVFFKAGLSNMSYRAVAPLFHRIPGGLLHTNIVVCTLFGAVSGTSSATAAAIGSVAYPELVRRGYSKGATLGSLAGGGTLGLLIPPSLSFILYGAMQEVSIAKLFLAGIVPGIMMAILFMVFIAIKSKFQSITPEVNEKPSLNQIFTSLLRLWPLVLLIASVMVPLYGGLATPTESAGCGLAVAVLLGFLTRGLNLKGLWDAFYAATAKMGSLMFIFAGACILRQAISILALPEELLSSVVKGASPYYVLMVVALAYLILGCFFDGLSLLLMTIPFVYPILAGVGFDPIWIGVFITIMMEVGMITPPVGPNLFILVTVSGNEISLSKAGRETLPYWLLLLAGSIIITIFPSIATFLPRFFS